VHRRAQRNNPKPNNYNNRGPSNNNGKCPICQGYEKEGHTVVQCWYCFDESYGSKRRTAIEATHSYGVDTNWYTDTDATYHITSELEKLDVRHKYNGTDQVNTVSGLGMNISHIGNSVISTPHRDLILKNILHVPQATKNLLFVHRFTIDDHASLEYFPNFFLVEDLDTWRSLLNGWCRHGLYPLPPKVEKACFWSCEAIPCLVA
jgi:hypothetical protein